MLAELAVLIKADIKQFQKNIGSAKSTLNNFGSTATSIGTKLSASLTLPIAGVGITALKTASDFEQLEVRLNTLTGSAEAGAKQFQRLQQFSAGTPFQLQDLVKANNTLLGFGLNAEDAFNSLQQLGDVASATGADLQSIAVAFGQSSAEGKLFTRDIRQFINQGVPAVDLLAQSMGVARSEVFTLAEEGKISFQILQDAIAQSTSEGGKFAGATKAQSKTIAGLFSTLKDNVALALGELGNELVKVFNLNELIPELTKKIQIITDVFKNLDDDVKRRLISLAGVLGAGGPILLAIGLLIKGVMAISLPVVGVIALVSGIAYIFGNAFGQAGSFVGGFKLIFAKMVNFVIDDLIRLTGVMSNLPLGVGTIFQNLTGTLIKFKADTEDSADAFTPLADGLNVVKETYNALKTVVTDTSKAIKEGVDPSGVNQALANVKPTIPVRVGEDVIIDVDYAEIDKILNENPIQIDMTPVVEPGSIADLNRQLQQLQVIQSLTSDPTKYQAFSAQIKSLRDRMADFTGETQGLSNGLSFANSLAKNFTSSFGQGMANIVVQGQKLVDVLENIGRLLLSSAIQLGIQSFLTGGLGGTGFFGDAGGLFGKIFNRQRGGSVLGNTPYMVGEVGPELFVPNTKGSIVSNRDLMGGASNTAQAFEQALANFTSKIGPDDIFILSQKGRYGF